MTNKMIKLILFSNGYKPHTYLTINSLEMINYLKESYKRVNCLKRSSDSVRIKSIVVI